MSYPDGANLPSWIGPTGYPLAGGLDRVLGVVLGDGWFAIESCFFERAFPGFLCPAQKTRECALKVPVVAAITSTTAPQVTTIQRKVGPTECSPKGRGGVKT